MINFIVRKNRYGDYLLNKRLCITMFLFILMPYTHVMAQVFDISQLQELQELQELQGEKREAPFLDEEKTQNERVEQRKDKESLENEIKDFGYSGSRDFVTSPQPKTLGKSLKYFGYDYFVDAPTTFAPATDIPIPPDYILGSGDEVKIILFGNKNKQYTLKVTRDGDIFFPEIGPISVAGLTFQDLKETIQKIVDNQIIGTKVSITLGALRSINIFVLGEASQPGMFTVSSLSNLTNAVFASGGIKTSGSLRNIEVKRNGQVLSTFDFYNLLLKGDTSDDVRLMTGDVVFIPPITKTIGISGEVERPGIYELRADETAEDLISFAGTLKPKADIASVEIQRIDPMGNGFNLTYIDLSQSSFSDLYLSNGDILTIYPVVNRMSKAILVSGHAQKPGFYPWKDGMKMLDLVKSAEDFLQMTDMNYVLIKRENNVDQSYQIIQVNFEELFSKPDSDQNVTLKERDEVIFFPYLLTPELIKVKVIEGEYNNLDDERQGLAYIKKSIKEAQTFKTIANTKLPTADVPIKAEENKFFQYTIHDYCMLSEEYVTELLRAQEKTSLTDYCRRKLLDPIIALFEQQGSSVTSEDTVEIFGNVTFPNMYPLPENGTLKQLIQAAGGLKNATYADEIEITSRIVTGKEIVARTITTAFRVDDNPILLKPLDVITIKKLSTDVGSVFLGGEVFFPGQYPISPNESINNLLKRAGGLKDTASLIGAVFKRESLKEIELSRLRKLQSQMRRNILLSEQSGELGQTEAPDLQLLNTILFEEFDENEVLGRLVINLESIIDGSADDIILEHGDELVIPKVRQVISVFGEVYVPNSHIFKDNFQQCKQRQK